MGAHGAGADDVVVAEPREPCALAAGKIAALDETAGLRSACVRCSGAALIRALAGGGPRDGVVDVPAAAVVVASAVMLDQ